MTPPEASPDLLWRTFAPVVAGSTKRPMMRVSRDGGATYARPQHVTEQLPTRPAAVLTYGQDGTTSCLVADFDIGPRGRHQAAAEANVFASMIAACGGAAVVDRSPTGGRHVYVPLQQPRRLEQVRLVMIGLAARFRTLDKAPMSNAVSGAIRPPGSPHPRGGHQQLVTPFDDAVEAFRRRNDDEVWRNLVAALGPVDVLPPLTAGGLGAGLMEAPHAHRPGGRVPLGPDYDAIARTGAFDPRRYRSPSEARQAVLSSAYIRGWTLREVAEQLDGGLWRGLSRLYDRYGRHRHTALRKDWNKAASWAEQRSYADRSDTRGSTHTPRRDSPLGEHRHLRRWWSAMRAAEPQRYASRADQSTRLVLRALAAAAQRKGSRYVKVGCRSLALGSTLSHQTVAVALRELRDEEDPLVALIENGRGHGNADVYELRIPDAHAALAATKRWRAGLLESIHPAFAELGVPAALVYDALGEASDPIPTVQEVACAALLGRDSTGAALRELAAYGLAELDVDGWRRGPASLAAIADLLGALDWHEARVERYREQRRLYVEAIDALRRRREEREFAALAAGAPLDDAWVIDLREPPEDGETAMQLLERTLGAAVLEPV